MPPILDQTLDSQRFLLLLEELLGFMDSSAFPHFDSFRCLNFCFLVKSTLNICYRLPDNDVFFL